MLQLQAVVPRSVLILYPDRADLPDGGQPLRVPRVEGAPAVQPARGAGRAGADHRRRRGGRAARQGPDAQPAMARRRACSTTTRRSRAACCATCSVLGPIGDLPAWCEKYGVRKVIIALPSANHVVRRRVAELCAGAGVEALTVPSYEDLISGRLALTTIRNVELDDLLGRDPVVLDSAGLGEWLGNRVVMVTGAGGSIGAELTRQIARFRPARLVLFDLSEAALYEIQTALADAFAQLPLVAVVGDVKHAALVEDVLAREKPSVIFHAGAYKHVPLMEETNAWQAVRNNAYGTWVLARAAVAAPRREIRARVVGQGGQSDQRDGRDQAPRRNRVPEPAGRRHAVRARALRQRVRQRGQRHPALSRADRARRPGHGHASGDHALLHVAVGSDAAAAAGRTAGHAAARSSCSRWASPCASSTSRAT